MESEFRTLYDLCIGMPNLIIRIHWGISEENVEASREEKVDFFDESDDDSFDRMIAHF